MHGWLSSSTIMNSEIRDRIAIDPEADGLGALPLRRARPWRATPMEKGISEPHEAIVAGGEKYPGEAC